MTALRCGVEPAGRSAGCAQGDARRLSDSYVCCLRVCYLLSAVKQNKQNKQITDSNTNIHTHFKQLASWTLSCHCQLCGWLASVACWRWWCLSLKRQTRQVMGLLKAHHTSLASPPLTHTLPPHTLPPLPPLPAAPATATQLLENAAKAARKLSTIDRNHAALATCEPLLARLVRLIAVPTDVRNETLNLPSTVQAPPAVAVPAVPQVATMDLHGKPVAPVQGCRALSHCSSLPCTHTLLHVVV